MRNFYHSWKFCALTINFSDVWARKPAVDTHLSSTSQKCFEYVSKTSWNWVTKNRLTRYTSWKSLEDIFARRVEDVLKRFLQDFLRTFSQDVLKTSWRRLEVVLKTSWRHLQDVWPRRIYWSWSRRLEDVFKTSSQDLWVRQILSSWSRRLEDVFKTKTSSEDEDESPLQDVFKTSSSRRMFAGE